MTTSEEKHIFIIETDPGLQQRIKNLITSSLEHRVSLFSTGHEALDALKKFEGKAVALVISSFRIPKMKGNEILRQTRSISPRTERMLISDVSDINIMISAVNKAEIHSCLIMPFRDMDLINQVENACLRYRNWEKKENLSRVTRQQNHQLFKMARKFKKIEANQLKDIQERSISIRELKERMETEPGVQETVSGYLKETGTAVCPETLASQWSFIHTKVKTVFSRYLARLGKAPLDYSGIKFFSAADNMNRNAAKELLKIILKQLSEESRIGHSRPEFARNGLIDDHLDLAFSKNNIQAFIKIKKFDLNILNLENIHAFLADKAVTQGVCPDEEIQSWLRGGSELSPPFCIASGRPPELPMGADIKFHFQEKYLQPGKLKDDGTIDFADRGKIPFVTRDTCLAVKTLPVPGKPGLTVLGEELTVPEPEDINFEAGSGARISPDGTKIHADTDGQPCLDALGKISVLKEYQIEGDVDFKSGNVDFDGNLTVNGSIRQGFKVKAASLTCRQVEGGQIELTGNLNCSEGIVDAKIVKVNGTIQAKYINNSVIDSFGDLIIQKEIIDSKIKVSGRVINTDGSILSSEICAKGGIETGNVGTDVAQPSILTVGLDLYVQSLVSGFEAEQERCLKTVAEINCEISGLNRKNTALHEEISRNAHLQDRSQLQLSEVEAKKSELKASGNMVAYHKVKQAAAELEKDIKQAEKAIDSGFERQDAIAREIAQKKERINQLEAEIQATEKEKLVYLGMTARKKSKPEVVVKKRIMSGNRINGPNTNLTLTSSGIRCIISEVKHANTSKFFYEMIMR